MVALFFELCVPVVAFQVHGLILELVYPISPTFTTKYHG
jgi:hypothetical protein